MLINFIKSSDLGQWIVIFVGVVAAITAGEGFGWPLGALPKMEAGQAGFDLTKGEESWMVSVVFIGNVLSPIPAGYIMDRLGRKRSLLLLSTTIILPWVLILTIHRIEALYVARFLTGVWTGSLYTIVPVYIAEVVESRIRGLSVSLMAISLYIGCLPMVSAGPYVDYDVLNAITISVPVVLFFGLLYIPESPYFFLMKGEEEAARKSLQRVREQGDVDRDVVRIKDNMKSQMENKSTFTDIFKSRVNRKAILIVIVLGVIQRTSGLSILFTYGSVILPDSFVSREDSVLILVIVWIVAGALGVNGVDKFGRRVMFALSCFGSGLMMAVVCAWFYLNDNTHFDVSNFSWIPLLALILQGFVYSLGLISVPTIVQGEIFPINIKAKASSLSSINMAIFSGVVVKIFHPMEEALGTYSIFLICVTSSFLGGLFAIFFMFETKGRSLEEIQNVLESKTKKKTTDL